ncbi:hypothetical protein A6A27_33815 [Micromonospora sp. CB01531]|nr:hypothetical protein A6A27_33815 [Micromonospora sp. CB01531]
MPVITFRRAFDVAISRQMMIEIDGEIIGSLERGASQSFVVAPGPYVVRVRLDRQSSRPIHVDLDDTETITLEAAAGKRSSTVATRWSSRRKCALDLWLR